MIFQHLQLLAPHIQLGQNEARIEGVEVQECLEIQETMIFNEPVSQPYRIISIETDGISGISITY
jgi:hypothetical protein